MSRKSKIPEIHPPHFFEDWSNDRDARIARAAWNARTERSKRKGRGWRNRYRTFEEFWESYLDNQNKETE